ncbi:hypothetical protein Tco_0689648 [Tanacetum coccineum]
MIDTVDEEMLDATSGKLIDVLVQGVVHRVCEDVNQAESSLIQGSGFASFGSPNVIVALLVEKEKKVLSLIPKMSLSPRTGIHCGAWGGVSGSRGEGRLWKGGILTRMWSCALSAWSLPLEVIPVGLGHKALFADNVLHIGLVVWRTEGLNTNDGGGGRVGVSWGVGEIGATIKTSKVLKSEKGGGGKGDNMGALGDSNRDVQGSDGCASYHVVLGVIETLSTNSGSYSGGYYGGGRGGVSGVKARQRRKVLVEGCREVVWRMVRMGLGSFNGGNSVGIWRVSHFNGLEEIEGESGANLGRYTRWRTLSAHSRGKAGGDVDEGRWKGGRLMLIINHLVSAIWDLHPVKVWGEGVGEPTGVVSGVGGHLISRSVDLDYPCFCFDGGFLIRFGKLRGGKISGKLDTAGVLFHTTGGRPYLDTAMQETFACSQVWGSDDGDDNEGGVMVGYGGEAAEGGGRHVTASDKGDRANWVTRNIFRVGQKSPPGKFSGGGGVVVAGIRRLAGGGGAAENIEGEERAFVCCVCVFMR